MAQHFLPVRSSRCPHCRNERLHAVPCRSQIGWRWEDVFVVNVSFMVFTPRSKERVFHVCRANGARLVLVELFSCLKVDRHLLDLLSQLVVVRESCNRVVVDVLHRRLAPERRGTARSRHSSCLQGLAFAARLQCRRFGRAGCSRHSPEGSADHVCEPLGARTPMVAWALQRLSKGQRLDRSSP